MTPKAFFITLFVKQNKHHKHSVLGHTLKVFYHCLMRKKYKMLAAALLHDIGKPVVAYQKPEDVINDEYSFTDHEEKSYQIIKNIPLISTYTKKLVRYHYLIRGMAKAKEKNDTTKHEQLVSQWNSLSRDFQEDLRAFLVCDDLGKG